MNKASNYTVVFVLFLVVPLHLFGFSYYLSQRISIMSSPTDSILRLWLSPQVVNNNKPIANTFYFWTSVRELDSVVKQQRLLRTGPGPQGDPLADEYLEQLVKHGVHDNEEIAHVLFSGSKQRIRTAWPCYWSTLAESNQKPGNDQLVQVVLMDSALIVSFAPDERQKHRWAVYDLRGNVIPMEKALERKRHIAAVFMQGKRNVTFTGPQSYHVKDYYRTFILCNEEMIKSWHHAVPGMQAKILNDLDYLLLLNAYYSEGWTMQAQGRKGKIARASWTMPAAEMRMNELFFATQRFAWMSGVDASQQSTMRIVDLLRERWKLQVNPAEKFPAAGR